MREKWLDKVEAIAADAAQKEGCVLYDIEFVGLGKGRTLRVYIDKADQVGIEECSNVSKNLNEALDLDENLIPGGAYQLEVSTPGVDRHLNASKPWHFEKVVGKKIYLKTNKSLEAVGVTDKKWMNAKTVEEVLEGADQEGVSFSVKGVNFKIPYQMIEKAKLVFVMPKGAKK